MRRGRRLSWIIALLLLVTACHVAAHIPPLTNFAVLFWGLSLIFLVIALILAIMRSREHGRGR